MGWLTKILKGSSHKGHYHGRYRDDGIWNEPNNSAVTAFVLTIMLQLTACFCSFFVWFISGKTNKSFMFLKF